MRSGVFLFYSRCVYFCHHNPLSDTAQSGVSQPAFASPVHCHHPGGPAHSFRLTLPMGYEVNRRVSKAHGTQATCTRWCFNFLQCAQGSKVVSAYLHMQLASPRGPNILFSRKETSSTQRLKDNLRDKILTEDRDLSCINRHCGAVNATSLVRRNKRSPQQLCFGNRE